MTFKRWICRKIEINKKIANYPVKIYATWPCNSRFLLIHTGLAGLLQGLSPKWFFEVVWRRLLLCFPFCFYDCFSSRYYGRLFWISSEIIISHKLFYFLKLNKLYFNSLGEYRISGISVIITEKTTMKIVLLYGKIIAKIQKKIRSSKISFWFLSSIF